MNIHELKEPYIQLVNTLDKPLSEYDCIDIIDKLDTYNDVEKNNMIAVLVCKSWQSLVNIFYKQSNTSYSAEECYDIFMEAFNYIISTKPWKRESNSLYGDSDAFIKAMMTCTWSRKLNYTVANYRQKRVLNQNSLSIDKLADDFQDGQFTAVFDDYEITYQEVIKIIQSLFSKKDYLTAFLLDSFIVGDIFDEDNNINTRKLHKHIKEIDANYCEYFANTYQLNLDEIIYCLKYFQGFTSQAIDDKIAISLKKLKENYTLKQSLY